MCGGSLGWSRERPVSGSDYTSPFMPCSALNIFTYISVFTY